MLRVPLLELELEFYFLCDEPRVGLFEISVGVLLEGPEAELSESRLFLQLGLLLYILLFGVE